jgi:hypothetical protein
MSPSWQNIRRGVQRFVDRAFCRLFETHEAGDQLQRDGRFILARCKHCSRSIWFEIGT